MKHVVQSRIRPAQNNQIGDRRRVTSVNLEPASLEDEELTYRCPRQDLAAAVAVIGGKWKALIVCELSRRSMRYHEIDAALSYVSHRVLTYELQILMRGGVITRSSEHGNARAYRYSLTIRGRALYAIVQELARWARADADSTHPM